MSKCFVMAAVLAALATAARADAPAPRKVTFEDAIQLATAQSPGVAIAAEGAATADSQVAGVKAKRLPSASIGSELHRYREGFSIMFGTMNIPFYEDLTTNTTISIAQPLTGLYYLSELVGAAEHGAGAAHAELDKAKLDAAYGAADGYVHALEAIAAADVAHKSVAQIEGELVNAQKLREADTYNDIDVLRFQSAKAAADQSAVKADSAREAAIAALVVALGLHDGDAIEVVDDLPGQAPPLTMTVAAAQDRALSTRPELHAARERIAAAAESRRAAKLGYLPDVRAVGVYMHNTGYGDFQPSTAEFIGLTLQWNVWDWGASYQAGKQAAHAETTATLTADALVDQVRLDVRRHWLDAKAGYDSLASADTQLKTAEEAHRLQQVRFDAGAATTTDVLDAETDVARARLVATNARYDYFLALVALARSVGDLPSPGATR